MRLRPFGLYCSACLGILFVSILRMCCSHFSWYCFISFTIFSAPVFSLIHWFFSLSSFVIPRRCLKKTLLDVTDLAAYHAFLVMLLQIGAFNWLWMTTRIFIVLSLRQFTIICHETVYYIFVCEKHISSCFIPLG